VSAHVADVEVLDRSGDWVLARRDGYQIRTPDGEWLSLAQAIVTVDVLPLSLEDVRADG
jgi:hypothetical protein